VKLSSMFLPVGPSLPQDAAGQSASSGNLPAQTALWRNNNCVCMPWHSSTQPFRPLDGYNPLSRSTTSSPLCLPHRVRGTGLPALIDYLSGCGLRAHVTSHAHPSHIDHLLISSQSQPLTPTEAFQFCRRFACIALLKCLPSSLVEQFVCHLSLSCNQRRGWEQ